MKRICIDLGNSSTRTEEKFGEVKVTPNNFVILDMEQEVKAVVDSKDVYDNLDFKIYKNNDTSEGSIFPCHVVEGSLVDKAFTYASKPNINLHKYMQDISYINLLLQVALDALESNDSSKEYTLYVAVPPVEFGSAEEKFNSVLVGEFTVVFDRIGKTVTFNVVGVKCVEEAKAALMSFFFKLNENGELEVRKEHDELRAKQVLLIDIGAGTTDFCIVRNRKYLDKTSHSIKSGGNVITDYVRDKICETECIDLSSEEAEQVVITGRLQIGNETKIVSDIVDEGKRELAERISNNIPDYLKRIAISPSTINAVVVSGGGSLESKYVDEDGVEVVTSKPISEGITEKFKSMSPGTMVLYYGDRARYANVDGIRILAAIDDKVEQN